MTTHNLLRPDPLITNAEVAPGGMSPLADDKTMHTHPQSLALAGANASAGWSMTTGSAFSEKLQHNHTEFHAVLIMPPGSERDAMAMGLWDAGMLVTTFASPHEAEGVLIGERVHVVLVDLALGPTMGPEIVRWLHATGRSGVTVATFGEAEPELTGWLSSQGVTWCVPRPLDATLFGRQLGAAMGFKPASWR